MIINGVLSQFLDELPLSELRHVWFQHNGAPAHWSAQVRQTLDAMFPDQWVGRGSDIAWPARSPDLTPMDFFLWGYIKAKVCYTRPTSKADLMSRITVALGNIPPTTFKNVQQSIIHRALLCIASEGQHVEHLLH